MEYRTASSPSILTLSATATSVGDSSFSPSGSLTIRERRTEPPAELIYILYTVNRLVVYKREGQQQRPALFLLLSQRGRDSYLLRNGTQSKSRSSFWLFDQTRDRISTLIRLSQPFPRLSNTIWTDATKCIEDVNRGQRGRK